MTLRETSLADAMVEWLKQARERGVYIEYRFEGAGHVSDSVVVPVVSTIVERAIDEAAGRAPEDRWMDLLVEREQNWLVVECAACGEGPEETMWRGQRVLLERYEDSFRLRVEMRPA